MEWKVLPLKTINSFHNEYSPQPLAYMSLDCGVHIDRYMAPEVFMHKHYDKSVDVFSFAIIVQEV